MKRPIQISFRITEEQARQLDECRGQDSRGDCVRRLMVAGLEGQDSERLLKYLGRIHTELDEQYSHQSADTSKTQRRLDDLDQRVQALREDLAMAVAGVLANMGRSLTQDQAEEFVRRTLLSDLDGTKEISETQTTTS